MRPATASPVWMPMPIASGGAPSSPICELTAGSESASASPASTARRASSACATGAPNSALAPSPMYSSTTPPWPSIAVLTAVRKVLRTCTRRWGSSRSESAVNAAHVREQHETRRSSPPSAISRLEQLLGNLGRHHAPEQVAHAVALGEALHHRVERSGERAELVALREDHGALVVAPLDAPGAARQLARPDA